MKKKQRLPNLAQVAADNAACVDSFTAKLPPRKHHELKTWQPYFDAIKTGVKTFEVRKNDRGFCQGDTLCLREFDPNTQDYSGEVINAKIGFVLHGVGFGIEPEFCVFSIILKDISHDKATK